MRLRDGRRLAYTITGPASGRPVLYCHGAIGTPVHATVDLERITRRLAIRYIAPSRPGIGGSSAHAGRTLLDFAVDVEQLLDRLALDHVDIAGVSAGGPYALAVAHAIPERVGRVALCSSLSPLCAPHRTPGMQRRIRLALAVVHGAPQPCAKLGNALLPLIARHGGVDGLIDDFLVCSRAWGFDAGSVASEVHLWHGGRDLLVPVEHALQLAALLPRCRVFVDPDEGHHFFRANLDRILAALLARRAGEPAQAALRSSASGGRSTG